MESIACIVDQTTQNRGQPRSISHAMKTFWPLSRAVLAGTVLLSFWGTANAQIPPAPIPHPGTGEAQLNKAKRLIASDDFRNAASLLTAYIQIGKSSVEAHRLLAYSYLRLNDPKHSLEEYTSAAAIERPRPADLWNVAKDYVLLGDMRSAEHWTRAGLELDQNDPEGWYELGRILYTQQHFQDATDAFGRALLLLPRNVKAENNLGLAYEGLNRLDDAVLAYRQAIEWQQHDPHPSEQPLINLGIVLVHQGKFEEAFSLLNQAVTIAPNDPRIREEMGHLCLQMNRLDQAQVHLQQAIALNPDKASAHFLLGKTYHLQGQESKAKAEFTMAASLSRSKPDPL